MKENKQYISPKAMIIQFRPRLCNVVGSPYGDYGNAGNYNSDEDNDYSDYDF